ncbi:MAG: hypothetical protein SWY16_11915 [Cyanobacteriota bacterium]|nr:hypothetical protein [Cyanobacteriota bacterium]
MLAPTARYDRQNDSRTFFQIRAGDRFGGSYAAIAIAQFLLIPTIRSHRIPTVSQFGFHRNEPRSRFVRSHI